MAGGIPIGESQLATLGRRALVPGMIALALVTAVLVFLGVSFVPVGDPRPFSIWLATTSVIVVANFAGIVVFAVRRPPDHEVVEVWQWLGRIARTLLNLAIIVSPWVLLPGAQPAFVAMMLVLYLWFLVTQVMATADPHSQVWLALVGVPASVATALLSGHSAYAVPLSLFIVAAAASLFALQRLIRTGALRNLSKLPSASVEVAMPTLTRRQVEVLGHLNAGRSNKEIARALGVSPETVKTHVAQTLAAMASANRVEAASKARALGLV